MVGGIAVSKRNMANAVALFRADVASVSAAALRS